MSQRDELETAARDNRTDAGDELAKCRDRDLFNSQMSRDQRLQFAQALATISLSQEVARVAEAIEGING